MANNEEARRKKYTISMLTVNSVVGQTFKEKNIPQQQLMCSSFYDMFTEFPSFLRSETWRVWTFSLWVMGMFAQQRWIFM